MDKELQDTFANKIGCSDESSSCVGDPDHKNRGVTPFISVFLPKSEDKSIKRSAKTEEQMKKLKINNSLAEDPNKNSDDEYSYSYEEEEEEEEEIKNEKEGQKKGQKLRQKSSDKDSSSSYEYVEEEEEEEESKEEKDLQLKIPSAINKEEDEEEDDDEYQTAISSNHVEIIHSARLEDDEEEEEYDFDNNDNFENKGNSTEDGRRRRNRQIPKFELILPDSEPDNQTDPSISGIQIEDNQGLSPPTQLSSPSPLSPLSSHRSKQSNATPPTTSANSSRNIFGITSPTNFDLKLPLYQSKPIPFSSVNDPQTFRKFINGELGTIQPVKPNIWKFVTQKRQLESYMSHKEVVEKCAQLLAAKNLSQIKMKIENPGDVRDMIDELNRMKVEAITNADYQRSKKIEEVICYLRTQYRLYDRESFQKERLGELRKRLDNTKRNISELNGKIKDDLKENQKKKVIELEDLEATHEVQLQDLEGVWRDPQTTRKFTKRSSSLLQGQYIERHYALIGEYDQATAVRKINQKIEKVELADRHSEMNGSFENARSHLLNTQEEKKQIILESLNDNDNQTKLEQKRELDKLFTRQKMIENLIVEEGNMENFAAKKFKRSAGTILPMSVTVNGGTALAPNSSGTARDVGNLINFKQSPIASPLPLPPLSVKKLKKPKKKPDVERKAPSSF